MAGRSGKPPIPRPEGCEPLAMAPPKAVRRYRRLCERVHREAMAGVKAKCLDCCAWEYAEAKSCEIKTCPLWALNRRIFHRRTGAENRPRDRGVSTATEVVG